jgi:tRNA (mo5U34)-methyltransferase
MAEVDIEDILNYPYWRHRIDLGDGNFTPGTKDASDWDRLKLPEDMTGKSFLDIGAFDGLHSFEAERRGAERVMATDIWDEGGDEEWWYGREPKEESIDMVRDYTDSIVERKTISVENISPEEVGEFDITVCSKVIPFVDSPLSAIKNLVSVSNEMVVIESAKPRLDINESTPIMEFAKETTSNPNRRWHPTTGCIEKLLENAGCVRTESYTVPNTVEDNKRGYTVRDTDIYRDYSLSDKVDTVKSKSLVKILYKKDGSYRVEYRENPSEPFRQGWVEESDIEEGRVSESSRLLRRATEVVREDGVLSLPPKALQYLKPSSVSGNSLVHGYLS